MKKQEHTVPYTADELDEMLRRGESQTDWVRVDAPNRRGTRSLNRPRRRGRVRLEHRPGRHPGAQAAIDRAVRRRRRRLVQGAGCWVSDADERRVAVLRRGQKALTRPTRFRLPLAAPENPDRVVRSFHFGLYGRRQSVGHICPAPAVARLRLRTSSQLLFRGSTLKSRISNSAMASIVIHPVGR